ncbi:immunity 49 family protein [Mycobacteroides saopaulense]|uniref:Immunity protein 49 n=1 Tax=Mycobacteroides saopaulense TaxID=1578165 RepID=A0ABX3BWJ4_9MYCO|nr:immunity 49 family protein [Mycobacteroides saopaulense]OHT81188.1 hypothetical protein BKG68_23385 [Mycobacteroides saopaulense]OHU07337.1 hypothetical protein BKG73_18990 [Mycobacteroides saopaulense]
MTAVIVRHEIDLTDTPVRISELADQLGRYRARIQNKPKSVERIFKYSTWITDYLSVHDPRAASVELWDNATQAVQAGAAMFLNANSRGDEIDFAIGGASYQVTSTGPNSSANASDWLSALWMAITCRARQQVQILTAVENATLRSAGTEYDQYIYDWILALQKFIRNEAGVVGSILQAMESSDPAVARHTDEEVLLLLLFPPIELLYNLTQREDEKFNIALTRALEAHKSYWSKSDERRNDPLGFIAWAPLAIATLAHDSGVQVEVESDYLPIHLLLGSRVTESSA